MRGNPREGSMYKYILLNNISEEGFKLLEDDFALSEDLAGADLAIVRSAKMNDLDTKHMLAVARAGSGTNNVPVERCAHEGVVVFNTPGANANAVKELLLLGMLLSARDVLSGNAWLKAIDDGEGELSSKIEKGKSLFDGSEIFGKKAAIIGMGAIGSSLANALHALGMDVAGYSPSFAQGKKPKGLTVKVAPRHSVEEALRGADYVILSLPLKDDTRGMFGNTLFSLMKQGSVLLNFSRAELINEDSLEQALAGGALGKYVTDFATDRVLKMKNTICLPHMGASTKESTENCAVMAASQIKDYALNGNIKNSVNYPDIDMGEKEGQRLSVLFHADEQYSRSIEQYLIKEKAEIKRLKSASENGWGAMLVDLSGFDENLLCEIESMDHVTRVRLI